MVREAQVVDERTAEMTLTGGCLVCGGDVRMRISDRGARVVCMHCEWIGHPEVKRVAGGLHVNYTPTGQA